MNHVWRWIHAQKTVRMEYCCRGKEYERRDERLRIFCISIGILDNVGAARGARLGDGQPTFDASFVELLEGGNEQTNCQSMKRGAQRNQLLLCDATNAVPDACMAARSKFRPPCSPPCTRCTHRSTRLDEPRPWPPPCLRSTQQGCKM